MDELPQVKLHYFILFQSYPSDTLSQLRFLLPSLALRDRCQHSSLHTVPSALLYHYLSVCYNLEQILTSAQLIKTTNDDNKAGKQFAKSKNILHVDIEFHTDEIYERQQT